MSRLSGRVKVVQVDGGASSGAETMTVPLRPAGEGIEWEIICASGSQDDGAVLEAWWYKTPEEVLGVQFTSITATGANKLFEMFAYEEEKPAYLPAPVYSMWNRYPCFKFTASGAGKTGTVRALVIERLSDEAGD